MKELLSKKFWQDVKKTFDEAREDPPKSIDPPPPEEIKPDVAPVVEVPPVPEDSMSSSDEKTELH